MSFAGAYESKTDFDALRKRVLATERGEITSEITVPSVLDFDSVHHRYVLRSWPREVLIQKLRLSGSALENAYFKLVAFEPMALGLSEEPLGLDDFDGRNVLFHLLRARNFFSKLDDELNQRTQESIQRKITVRLRANRFFDEDDHFSKETAHNMSVYIPRDPDGRWQQEIWFHTQKVNTNWKPALATFALSFLNWPFGTLAWALTSDRYQSEGIDFHKNPSWIYHEAFHWATDAQHLLPVGRYSHPVAENLANYFGSVIEGQPVLGGNLAFADVGLSRSFEYVKRVKRSKVQASYDYTSFIASVFWYIRTKILGPSFTDRSVWELVKKANVQTYPSEVPQLFLAGIVGHPKYSEVEAYLSSWSCSFYNLDEKFDLYYKNIMGRAPRERPPHCN